MELILVGLLLSTVNLAVFEGGVKVYDAYDQRGVDTEVEIYETASKENATETRYTASLENK